MSKPALKPGDYVIGWKGRVADELFEVVSVNQRGFVVKHQQLRSHLKVRASGFAYGSYCAWEFGITPYTREEFARAQRNTLLEEIRITVESTQAPLWALQRALSNLKEPAP